MGTFFQRLAVRVLSIADKRLYAVVFENRVLRGVFGPKRDEVTVE